MLRVTAKECVKTKKFWTLVPENHMKMLVNQLLLLQLWS